MKLPQSYYENPDVVFLAKDLLGKLLYTHINGNITAGIIVETEAYFGVADKASHAYGGRQTKRTQTLYLPGGVAYVYLCYGMHYLFNVVSGPVNMPHAVLIRAIAPVDGLAIMENRRAMPVAKSAISAGPGALSKALGIDLSFNQKSLLGNEIWIEEPKVKVDTEAILAVPRVGVAYAKEHALLPLRFLIRGNKYVSKPNKF